MASMKFAPPAHLPDFDERHKTLWSQFISDTLDLLAEPQFYNPRATTPAGDSTLHAITWNAFPKDLLRAFGRERALVEADRLWSRASFDNTTDLHQIAEITPLPTDTVFRPQSEYCEWRVARDPDTGRIRRVTFTSEPPEYWSAMFGAFAGVAEFPQTLQHHGVRLYKTLVDRRVRFPDLLARTAAHGAYPGKYDPCNRWNTWDGIMHLCCPPNNLLQELKTAAQATRLYNDGQGRPLTYPDALACAVRTVSPNRNVDPTILSAINSLARTGAQVTLADPVGIYMDRIDTNGWLLPKGIAAADCVKIVRGRRGMISRLVVEVPRRTGLTLSDLTIGGVPLRHGGQLAECITVKLVVQVVMPVVAPGAIAHVAPPFAQTSDQPYVVLKKQPTEIVERPAAGRPGSRERDFDIAFKAYD